jgi:hypothetical protein
MKNTEYTDKLKKEKTNKITIRLKNPVKKQSINSQNPTIKKTDKTGEEIKKSQLVKR